MVADDELNIG